MHRVDGAALDEFQDRLADLLVEYTDRLVEMLRDATADADAVRDLIVAEIRARFGRPPQEQQQQ